MTSSTDTGVALRDDVFARQEELTLAGFLAGYSGLTREAYMLDLRQYVSWCAERRVALFGARRADIEAFGRYLETAGRARATISRRLCTITCFYRYAEQEDFIANRQPCMSGDPSSTTNPTPPAWTATRSVPACRRRTRTRADHALLSLLALNGLRVSEATGANIEALGLERGHRTLTILRKGGKTVIIPLAPRTARAIDLAVGERSEGPLFLGPDGQRLDRHATAQNRWTHRPHSRDPQTSSGPTRSPLVHHRRTRCRRPTPRRPRSRKPRRPPNHHALRPSAGIARPARHLHRGDLHRRRRPLRHPGSSRHVNSPERAIWRDGYFSDRSPSRRRPRARRVSLRA